jgi:hypothetical protein
MQGTEQEWRTVFFIASVILISGGLIFLLFSKGTVLSWADDVAAVDITILMNEDVERSTEIALRRDVTDYKSTMSRDASALNSVSTLPTSAYKD